MTVTLLDLLLKLLWQLVEFGDIKDLHFSEKDFTRISDCPGKPYGLAL